MPEWDRRNGIVLDWLARARDIVYVHAERMAYAVREERRRDTACEDSFLRVPAARVGGVGGLEDPQTLEAAHERAVA